jgi:hypothetical protein
VTKVAQFLMATDIPYMTDRFYKTAGRAKTHLQMPTKPAYRVEIDPAKVPNRTPIRRVAPTDNPQWGIGGGTESVTPDAIEVDISTRIIHAIACAETRGEEPRFRGAGHDGKIELPPPQRTRYE